jgi:two-component system, OmpR family, alkaline phosphatase synthesis response regulator PhoP
MNKPVMIKKRICVVEDDRDIGELIQYNLERDGFQVFLSTDGNEGLASIQQHKPDAVVLDIMLPEIDGVEICRILKQDDKTKEIPIIMLTAKSEESDIIVGLQLGADDYITKPFSPKVLVARVKAILRRSKRQIVIKDDVRDFGDLTIDLLKHKVVYRKKSINLTTIEFSILEFLSRTPGRVYTRDQMLDSIWKEGKFIVDRAVDVHIRGLRKKLDGAADFIETVRGIGYRFKDME